MADLARHRPIRRFRRAIVIAALPLALVACAGGGGDTVLVSAAASLTDAFGAMEEAFEDVHGDTDVILNLGGSGALREQILAGAPADVFASADASLMEGLTTVGALARPPTVFADASMAIATPLGNPAGVSGLADFADPGLLVGLCAEGVPCGDYARAVFAAAGIEPMVDTNEPNVRSLLTKIEAGELDAAVVYTTDIAASPSVLGIPIPESDNVRVTYPIAVLDAAPNRAGAEAFVAFVLSTDGRAILEQYGFGVP